MPRVSQKAVSRQQDWMERISRAKGVWKTWSERFHVAKAIDFYEGVQNPGYPAEEWITINKVYSHLKAQLPTLYSVNPYFYVRLKRAFNPNPANIVAWENKGEIRSAMLNYLKEELNLKEHARLAIQDGHFAFGVIKIGYSAEQVENPDAGREIEGESGGILLDDQGRPLIEPESIPVNEKYEIDRVNPRDFVWDEDSGPLEKNWKWLAERVVYETMDDIRAVPQFNKSAIKKIRGGGHEEGAEEEKEREFRKKGDVAGKTERKEPGQAMRSKDMEGPFPTWWIYEIKRKRMTVIAENGEIPLVDDEPYPPGIETHPFAILRYTLREDSPYPIPPMSQGIGPQKEYNMARSRLMTHRKRFNRKYVVNRAAFGPNADLEASKLESGGDGTMIWYDNPGLPAENVIVPIRDAPLDQMGYIEINALNADMIELFGGSSDEARGIAGADSATQAGILDKRLEVKESDAVGITMDWLKMVARKLDHLVQVNLTREEAILVSGPKGDLWVKVTPDDYQEIEGEWAYDVNVGATMPRLPQLERANWIAFMTMVLSFPPLLTAKHFMKRMAEMHHIEDEQMLEELRQLALQSMRGQVAAPQNRGSQPGVAEQRPISAAGGQSGGVLSLNQPGAGNLSQ